MSNQEPDSTAIRVALWRALHVQVDAPPHVLVDEIGLKLAAPDNWQSRRDMEPQSCKRARASIVGRARFIEDFVIEQAEAGVRQYVIAGAGLDTFAQRHQEMAGRLQIFELDQSATQQWKMQRLAELGYGIADWHHFVGVDFEAESDKWWEQLASAGFDSSNPATIVSTGVSMYISKQATAATMARIARLAPGSSLVMSFMVPIDLVEAEEQPMRRNTEKFAGLAGTPLISFYSPEEIMDTARSAGFRTLHHVSSPALSARYFADRTDGLRPSSSEELLVAGL